MSTQSPQVGDVSPDGQFRWDGAQWSPLARGYQEPTSWTMPLRYAAAGYLLLAALTSLVTQLLFETRSALERSIRAASPQLTGDQLQTSISVGLAFSWAIAAVVLIVGVVLAFGSYRGWRWVFWVDLVILAIGTIEIVTNAIALTVTNTATQVLPRGAIAFDLVLSVLAAALLIWFIVAAARYGPWAMRRPGA